MRSFHSRQSRQFCYENKRDDFAARILFNLPPCLRLPCGSSADMLTTRHSSLCRLRGHSVDEGRYAAPRTETTRSTTVPRRTRCAARAPRSCRPFGVSYAMICTPHMSCNNEASSNPLPWVFETRRIRRYEGGKRRAGRTGQTGRPNATVRCRATVFKYP